VTKTTRLITRDSESILQMRIFWDIRWDRIPGCSHPRSTTTAFIFDLSRGYSTNMALYDWQPSFSSSCGKSMEQPTVGGYVMSTET